MHVWALVAGIQLRNIAAVTAAAATVGGALVGLIFRAAAIAWRDERDASVEKAERLEAKVAEQAQQIERLEVKIADLEKRTNYEEYAATSSREHQKILEALHELSRGVHANTTATEFLIKQLLPAPAVPPTPVVPS